MKKIEILITSIAIGLLLTGCNLSQKSEYNIGDSITLGDYEFNIYKVKEKELELISKKSIATSKYYDDFSKAKNYYNEKSLIDDIVNDFTKKIKNQGYKIEDSGIISKEDLYELGKCEHSQNVSGRPYICNEIPDFIDEESDFWLSGTFKISSYYYYYKDGKIDAVSYEEEHGIRPTITIKISELKNINN